MSELTQNEVNQQYNNHSHDGINSRKINYVNLDNLPNTLTDDEKAALAGTSGTPSSTNKYVTNDDTATAATASKVARRLSTGDITVPTSPTNTTDAASKSYVDTTTAIITASDNIQLRDQSTGSTTKIVLFLIPGTVRFKIRAKTTNGGDGGRITVYVLNDNINSPTYEPLVYQSDFIDDTSYVYYTTSDIRVRAGDRLQIAMPKFTRTDLQVNYDLSATNTLTAFL